ncbi:MAG: hypothetical protein ACW964_15800 [Candidatus Hodarchaeales archaeon]|jgi:hypothetical protein
MLNEQVMKRFAKRIEKLPTATAEEKLYKKRCQLSLSYLSCFVEVMNAKFEFDELPEPPKDK